MNNGDTIYARASVLYQATSARGIHFIGTNGDDPYATTAAAQDNVFLYGQHDQITFKNAHWTNVDDLGSGLRMALDGCSTITLRDFQNDPAGRIDLYNSGYKSCADMLAHEVVTATGTLFTSASLRGDPILNIEGDTHLRPGQVVFHS
jgi:hypothetical protein